MPLLDALTEQSGLTGDELVIILIVISALLFAISVLLLLTARCRKIKIKKLERGELEKGKTTVASAAALQDMETENKRLKDEVWKLKTKLADEQYRTKTKEVDIDKKRKELDSELLKMSALEDEIDFLRTRVGKLEKEKKEMEARFKPGEAAPARKAEGGEGKPMYDEAEVEKIKAETMKIVERFAKEKDREIEKLKAENERLRAQGAGE